MKKILAVILCFALSSATAFADNDNTQKTKDITNSKLYTLSLKDAINLALKDNPQLNACDENLKSAEVSLSAARYEMARDEDKKIYASIDITSGYKKRGYFVAEGESNIRLGKLKKTQVENTIAYNVTEKYYNYKVKEKLIDIANESYKIAIENKNAVDKRFQLGMVSQMDVDNAQVTVTQSQMKKENSERDFEIAKEDMKIALQLDGIECSFNLTDGIEYKDYETNADSDIKKAADTRYDLTELREKSDLAKLYLDITGKFKAKNTSTYYQANSRYIQSSYAYDISKKKSALLLKSIYNSILSAKSGISIAEQVLSIKRQEYNAGKLRFEMGMITNMELTKIINDLSQCEVDLENSKLAYKLAVEKYQYNISVGLEN